MPAGQVRGVPQASGGRVEGAGGGDDDAVDVGAGQPGGLHGSVERLGDLLDDAVGAAAGGRQFELADGGPGDVGDRRADPQRGDIESGGERGTRMDGVQLGVGAGPPLRGAGGDHQTGGLQPCQQLRCGGLGEARQLPYLGARERTVLQQQVERGPVVHGAQYARCTGCCSGHDGCTCPSAAMSSTALLGKFPIQWEESKPHVGRASMADAREATKALPGRRRTGACERAPAVRQGPVRRSHRPSVRTWATGAQ